MPEDGTMLNVNELLGLALLTWLLLLVVLANESAAPAGLTEHALSAPRATSVNANTQNPVNRLVNNFNIRFGFLSFPRKLLVLLFAECSAAELRCSNPVSFRLLRSSMASLVRRARIFIGKITHS